MDSSGSTKEEREEFIKKLENLAKDQGVSLLEYIASTGSHEIRNIMRHMIEAALAHGNANRL